MFVDFGGSCMRWCFWRDWRYSVSDVLGDFSIDWGHGLLSE